MKSVILACIAASACALSEIESAFLGYITEYGKSYATVAEYEMRLRNFAVTHAFIEESNNDATLTYKAGHNKFSDYSREEYESMLTYKKTEETKYYTPYQNDLAATPIDWRNTTNGLNCMNAI